MSLLQKARHEAIIKEAKILFLEKGIDAVTMNDLASHLSIGEASLYRYFGKKQTLMIDAAILVWEEIYQNLKSQPIESTGYENLESFYKFFLVIFQSHPEFFRFVEELDVKMVQSNISSEELKDYELTILKFKLLFDDFFQMGLDDGTIKKTIDKDTFYYTSSHALISLCKKLASQPHLLTYEMQIKESTQIQCLIQICLHYIH